MPSSGRAGSSIDCRTTPTDADNALFREVVRRAGEKQ
jgi:hypothetical protein